MFLLNSCLSLFSAAPCGAPLLPKLRGHFAEFLNNASSAGLRILSSSTCVGLRYGYDTNDSGFSRHTAFTLPYFPSVVSRRPLPAVSSPRPGIRFPRISFPGRASRVCPRSSVASQYRNLHLSSIGYGPRPHLRSRLTQRRSALLWKPWIFGLEDSHLHLATHSGILSSRTSTRPYGRASLMRQCSPTDACASQSFGGVFEPRVFSARSLSTSELLRTL